MQALLPCQGSLVVLAEVDCCKACLPLAARGLPQPACCVCHTKHPSRVHPTSHMNHFCASPEQVRASDVVLPEGAVFVVANSLAISNKAESATKHYNLRVVECRWVLWVLVGRFGLEQGGKVLFFAVSIIGSKRGGVQAGVVNGMCTPAAGQCLHQQ